MYEYDASFYKQIKVINVWDRLLYKKSHNNKHHNNDGKH